MRGAGLFVRALSDIPAKRARRHLDWAAICVTSGNGRVNRRHLREWIETFDKPVALWTWFTTSPKAIAEAAALAGEVGAVALILNAEREIRGRPDVARRMLDAVPLDLPVGLVSYAVLTNIRDFPVEPFADRCAFGVPEIYDREGRYDPAYPGRAIRAWESLGFARVIPACGLYERDSIGERFHWREPQEIARHLALFPPGTDTVIGWPIKAGRKGIPARVLRALKAGLTSRRGG